MLKLSNCSNGKICRICLKKHFNMKSLYTSFNRNSFAFYINSIADIKITEDDQFPKMICKTCIKDLEIVIKFKEKCEKSAEILNSNYKNNDTESLNNGIIFVKEEKKELLKNSVENEDHTKLLVKDEKLETTSICTDVSSNNSIIDIEIVPKKYLLNNTKPSSVELNCVECGKNFLSETKRKMHWYNVHCKKIQILYKTCKSCLRVFKSPEAFDKHLNQKVSCREKFKGILVIGSGKSRAFQCTSCDHKSSSVADLRKHLLRHSGARPYICNLCPKSYKSHKALSCHKEAFHKLFKAEITCHLCGTIVQGKHKFNKHIHSHNNNKFQCDLCKSFFKYKWGLICHIKGHDNRKEYVCESCGKGFNTGFNLRNHIRRVHENIKDRKHSCNFCKYKTTSMKNLRDHVQHHSQDKLQCSICSRFIETSLKLVKHMKIHGEKKHFCLYCNKGFATKRQCTEHLRWVHNKKTKQRNQVAQEQTVVK